MTNERLALDLSLSLSRTTSSSFPTSLPSTPRKQVGLVVGRCGSKRDLVVAVIPTPAVGVRELCV